MSKFNVNDRVRIAQDGIVNPDYVDLTATVREVFDVLSSEPYYHIRIDAPPIGDNGDHGGTWSDSSLTPWVPRVGDSIRTREAFTVLPMGTVLTDSNGEVHTKIADPDLVGPITRHTTSWTDGVTVAPFYACWEWGAVVTSLPGEPEVEQAAEAPSRPLVHFSDELAGRDRSKARAAAHGALTRTLKPASRATLQAAVRGESVDAYELNAAIHDAMRRVVTRGNDAAHRRQLSEGIAHIGYIVQAVLESHADNLPAYAAGERSRVIEEVRSTLNEARENLDGVTQRNAELEEQLKEAQAGQADAEANAALLGNDLEKARAEVALQRRVIQFAKGIANDNDSGQIRGYERGLRDSR